MAEQEDKKKEYTLEEVSKHTTTKSCWLIIGNATNGGPKVYDVTTYLDDHPGGAEVMLDVAGQDADEFFEDIGHSKEAREELTKHYIGDFHLTEAAKAKLKAQQEASKSAVQKSPATTILVVLVAVAAIFYGVFQAQGNGTISAVPPVSESSQ